ncbi:MAG: alpha-L-fucosidase, partial [Miltoncostaeaceae bacterium]
MTHRMYESSWDSVGTHEVPSWYDDAKLGIFLHWGLYSVPGWAPQVDDIQ